MGNSKEEKEYKKFLELQEETREIFHRLWTRDVGTTDYNKNDWVKLRDFINNHTDFCNF
jgi:hypothetical protein